MQIFKFLKYSGEKKAMKCCKSWSSRSGERGGYCHVWM